MSVVRNKDLLEYSYPCDLCAAKGQGKDARHGWTERKDPCGWGMVVLCAHCTGLAEADWEWACFEIDIRRQEQAQRHWSEVDRELGAPGRPKVAVHDGERPRIGRPPSVRTPEQEAIRKEGVRRRSARARERRKARAAAEDAAAAAEAGTLAS